jgi:sugar diacid utilization regulator
MMVNMVPLAFYECLDEHEPFQIWVSLRDEPFRMVEHRGALPLFAPIAISDVSAAKIATRPLEDGDEYTEHLFLYPDRCHVVVRRFGHYVWPETEQKQLYMILHSVYAECLIERQQYILGKMTESIRSISSLLDLDDLLKKILENAMDVIPTAEMGVLWMYDDTLEALTAHTSVGQISAGTIHMKLKVGEGIIGRTYQDGKPRLYKSLEAALSDAQTMSMENRKYLTSVVDYKTIKSVMSVPITVDGRTECVLIFYQNGDYPLFTDYDLQLLQSFSDQVSIAMTNARLFQSVKSQNQQLVKRDQIHATLMQLSLQNNGPDTIIREMGRMLGLPLVYVDLLEYEWVPNQRTWQKWFTINELERIMSASHSPVYHVFTSSTGEQLFYLYPVVAMNAKLGFIVIKLNHKLSTTNLLVMEQGSTVLSLEMIRKHSLIDVYYKETNERFNELLLENDSLLLEKKGKELGIDSRNSFMVIIFECTALANHQVMDMQIHRLVTAMKQKFAARTPVLFGFRNKVTIVREMPSQKNHADTYELCLQFIREWEHNGGAPLRAGAGSCYEGLHLLAKSYREADRALSHLASVKSTGIISYSDIGVNRLFIHHSKEEMESFVDEIFTPLRTPEGNRLEETLLVYMASNRSAIRSVERLHIHMNTLYQRLHKIEELLDLSLENPEHMLRLQLACYLRESSMVER